MLTKEDISRISGVDLKLLDGYREIVELSGKEVDALPGGLNILALSLQNCPSLTELPKDLPVQYLSVMGCPNLKRLPENMELAALYLFGSDIEAIPEKSTCFSILVLIECTHIKHLPACCKAISKDFTIEDCPNLSSLPNLDVVHGEFNLRNTRVTSLPEHLKVGGSLWIYNTPIETLPAHIRVGKDISLSGCKNLKSLPDGLMVNGDLDLSETSIRNLPKGLIIKGDLVLTDSAVSSLPEDLIVGGSVVAAEDVLYGATINHEVPDNLTERIWEESGYIYGNDRLYRIMAKEEKHFKVLASSMDIYFILYGLDNLVEQSILYLVPDDNPKSYAFGIGMSQSEACIDLILKTADRL